MASYRYGYEPPTRPSDQGSRRMGTIVQPSSSKVEHREPDVIHISGPIDWRKAKSAAKAQPTGLPRPRVRDPSPATRPVPEKSSSGSSASTRGSVKQPVKKSPIGDTPDLSSKTSRNVLRRKPFSISQHAASTRPGNGRPATTSPTKPGERAASKPRNEASLRSEEAYNAIFSGTRKMAPIDDEPPPIIPELDRYRPRLEASPEILQSEYPFRIPTHDLPPSPQMSGSSSHSSIGNPHRYSGYSGSGYSASPSIGFSESPGPGAYSRDTTPTSMSSQSPGIMAPMKLGTPKLRQGSPAMNRSPMTRRRAGSGSKEAEDPINDVRGLSSLRESVTSSSSGSTVQGDGKTAERKKKKRLSPLLPSPPPRKSSQKFVKAPREEKPSPPKPPQVPTRRIVKPPDTSAQKSRNIAPASTASSKAPPIRPSRKGTPDLHSQIGDVIQIIQSNLASLSQPQDKPQNVTSRSIATSPSPKLPEHRPTKASRLPSPSPSQGSYREATPAPTNLGTIPVLKPGPTPSSSRNTSRDPSPSVSNSKPRFGLFRRKASETVEEKDRAPRKGPAAGTGHEGYGRFGLRGRSGSAQGMGRGEVSRRMSGSSQTSVGSNDPFLLERMSPVVIAGGGEIIENRNASSELSRTESNQSMTFGRPSLESKNSSKTSLSQGQSQPQSQNNSRTTLWPSVPPRDRAKRTSVIADPTRRRPSEGSDDITKSSSLAMRRSIQRLNNSTGAVNVPRPIDVTAAAASSSMTSLDGGLVSDESHLEMKMEVDRGRKVQLKKPKKLEKRPKSPRKWNFFHRAQPEAKSEAKPKENAAVKVILGRPAIKPMPHYAMIDSSDEQSPKGIELEDILRDTEQAVLSNEELDALQFEEYREARQRIENMQALLASSTPEPTPESAIPTTAEEILPQRILYSTPEPIIAPEVPQQKFRPTPDPTPTPERTPGRPSRLQQVGRIPKVVSARPEATSPKSFSRPFARLSTLQSSLDPSVLDQESVAKGPSPPKPASPEPSSDNLFPSSTIAGLAKSLRTSVDSKSESIGCQRDFLAFSPRKNSEATTSSSSGPTRSYDGITAIIPEPTDALVEDEVWDEYDNLIENDDTMKAPPSATSSHGVPFQYEDYESRHRRKSKGRSRGQSIEVSKHKAPKEEPRDSGVTSSSAYSQDVSSRSREEPTPEMPMSFTDFFSGYGDRHSSGAGSSGQKPKRKSNELRKSASSSNPSRKSESVLDTIEEQESNSPLAQVNLRVGSMTVSKWLTFGHVLFSPAREEVMGLEGSTKRHSILVIDGLGNDDWSFYAAETYPTSIFYNLSPTHPIPQNSTSSPTSYPLTPPNHRQVHHPHPPTKFPFPSSSFLIVIFRFPPCMPESNYRFLISEARRVLKPGGYLEMAILDLDMMNMGPKARRQVRTLKEGLRRKEDGCLMLGSASDVVMRCVGKKGFVGVRSCRVGVPVASVLSPAGSDASSEPASTAKGKGKAQPKKEKEIKEEPSISQMLSDPSPSGDINISKMVAKVGRWWYYRCYESVLHSSPDSPSPNTKGKGKEEEKEEKKKKKKQGSIFNDPSILKECEAWSSSFKLVVAYAQKPAEAVGRRTVSL